MANHACIAIGINRYQFLQPLNYGQADAQALQQFLVEQANLPSGECLLLTDSSLPINNQPTYPNRETIWQWLEGSRQHSHTNGVNSLTRNWRWFFFSGYGVCWKQVDYLMPIDGNPNDIPGTGISVRSLLKALKDSSDDNILVILDINRSPGLQAGAPAGAETVELAQEMGIPLVLSAQLDQFSHEAAALGNGLFTAALLEALRYYHIDITLADLDQYLGDRLPELSKHHWRPIQTPLVVIPSPNVKQQLILPTAVNSPIPQKTDEGIKATPMFGKSPDIKETYTQEPPNGATAPGQKKPVPSLRGQAMTSLVPATSTDLNQRALTPMERASYPEWESQNTTPKRHWWQQGYVLVGGVVLLLLVLLAAVTIRNRPAWIGQQTIERGGEEERERGGEGERGGILPSQPIEPSASPRREEPFVVKPTLESPTLDESRLEVNQQTLAQAKRLIQPNQASLFSQAIAQARQIRPGEPLYNQAQQDITRWSQVILDLAEGRAKQGNFGGAIAAAKLVPGDDPSIYGKAQQAINRWQVSAKQQQQNQRIIQSAKQQLRRNQASSYNRAINILRKIPSGQPGYAEAQQLIARWSRQIYLIANSRAWQGNLRQAIQTAALVPSGTPSYETAQKAISRWKVGRR
ncbi:MAG TPA: peptidase C14 [Cyanobacteria bacterium UBA11370]|nr:peptidase C14 [Cyanobacteria bacterium UBA11370]HBY79849.1 peptidase C14 [Cyanobacteria bacterium UBA11148]